MNEILNAMKARRSIRRFKPDPIEKEKLERICEAGIFAASGRNRQATVVIAITAKETRDRLEATNAEIMGGGTPFYGAPVILLVLADRSAPTYIYDGSLTMGNLMLAAHAEGLGGCWIHRARETFERPEWKEWLKGLGIDGDFEGIGQVALGYADCELPAPPERKENRIFYV